MYIKKMADQGFVWARKKVSITTRWAKAGLHFISYNLDF